MNMLHDVLIWIFEIGATVVVILASINWIRVANSGRSTARSFMALIFTFVFFLIVVLRVGDFSETTIRWLIVTYGGVLAVYIVGRTIEHREEIRSGRTR
jgi:membrane-associated PAP2 superfamily phosphatase